MTATQATTTKASKSKETKGAAPASAEASAVAKSEAAQTAAYGDGQEAVAPLAGSADANGGASPDDESDDLGIEIVQNYAVPEGYKVVSDDVEAYWDIKHGHKPIEFVPRSVRLMDSSRDDGIKSLALITGVLSKPQTLTRNTRFDKDDIRTRREQTAASQEQFPAGTVVGIWAKHGLSELMGFGGVQVWVAPAGTRPLPGRDQPMQLFKVAEIPGQVDAAGQPLIAETLALAGDSRRKSLEEPFLAQRRGKTPPWWLEVYEDRGVAMGREAFGQS